MDPELPWDEAYALVRDSASRTTRLLLALAHRRRPIALREIAKEPWRFSELHELAIGGVRGWSDVGVEVATPPTPIWPPLELGPAERRSRPRVIVALQKWLAGLDPLHLENALVSFHVAEMERGLVRMLLPRRDDDAIRKLVQGAARAAVRTAQMDSWS